MAEENLSTQLEKERTRSRLLFKAAKRYWLNSQSKLTEAFKMGSALARYSAEFDLRKGQRTNEAGQHDPE